MVVLVCKHIFFNNLIFNFLCVSPLKAKLAVLGSVHEKLRRTAYREHHHNTATVLPSVGGVRCRLGRACGAA